MSDLSQLKLEDSKLLEASKRLHDKVEKIVDTNPVTGKLHDKVHHLVHGSGSGSGGEKGQKTEGFIPSKTSYPSGQAKEVEQIPPRKTTTIQEVVSSGSGRTEATSKSPQVWSINGIRKQVRNYLSPSIDDGVRGVKDGGAKGATDEDDGILSAVGKRYNFVINSIHGSFEHKCDLSSPLHCIVRFGFGFGVAVAIHTTYQIWCTIFALIWLGLKTWTSIQFALILAPLRPIIFFIQIVRMIVHSTNAWIQSRLDGHRRPGQRRIYRGTTGQEAVETEVKGVVHGQGTLGPVQQETEVEMIGELRRRPRDVDEDEDGLGKVLNLPLSIAGKVIGRANDILNGPGRVRGHKETEAEEKEGEDRPRFRLFGHGLRTEIRKRIEARRNVRDFVRDPGAKTIHFLNTFLPELLYTIFIGVPLQFWQMVWNTLTGKKVIRSGDH